MEKYEALCGQDEDDSGEAPIDKDSVVYSCVNLTLINQTKKIVFQCVEGVKIMYFVSEV